MESPRTPPRNNNNKRPASSVTPMTPKRLNFESSPRTPPTAIRSMDLPAAPSQRRERSNITGSSPMVYRSRSLQQEFERAAEADALDTALRLEAAEYYEEQDGQEQIVPDVCSEVVLDEDYEDDLYYSHAYFFGDLVPVDDDEEDGYQPEDNDNDEF